MDVPLTLEEQLSLCVERLGPIIDQIWNIQNGLKQGGVDRDIVLKAVFLLFATGVKNLSKSQDDVILFMSMLADTVPGIGLAILDAKDVRQASGYDPMEE